MNAGQASADVYLFDEIGSDEGKISAAMVARALASLGPVTELHVYVNSPGGSVYQATGMYASFKNHPAKVFMHVTVAISAATHVVMAGDEIDMAENGVWMVHEPAQIFSGTVDELMSQVEQLKQIRDAVIGTYAARTKLPAADVAALLKKQTWMSAAEAKRLGFVDSITPNKTVSAHCDLSTYQDVPDWCRKVLGNVKEVTMVDPVPTPAPVVSAPAAPVPAVATPAMPMMTFEQLSGVIQAGVAKAIPLAIAEDRKKCADIVAMCEKAKVPHMAVAFLADPNMSVDGVRNKLFEILCASNVPAGPGTGQDPSMGGTGDPVMKWTADYNANKSVHDMLGISLQDYIRSQKMTAGMTL